MPDTPQRIATDTSQKLAIRFGETIKAYEAGESLNTADLKLIPLVFAGWLRYLMGVDDNGKTFDLSPDPLLETVCPYVAGFKLGEATDVEASVRPILENKQFWCELVRSKHGRNCMWLLKRNACRNRCSEKHIGKICKIKERGLGRGLPFQVLCD